MKKEQAKIDSKIVLNSIELNNQGDPFHNWIGFKSYKRLYESLRKIDDKHRCVSEMLSGTVKPYYDIDYDLEKNKLISKKEIDKIVDNFITELINYIKTKGFTITKDDIIIMTSHKIVNSVYTKFSYHIIVAPIKFNLVYENQRYDNINTACDLLYVLYEKDKDWVNYLDRQVYDTERSLRMVLNNKSPIGDVRLIKWKDFTMKTLSYQDFLRTLITYVDPKKKTYYIKTERRMNPKNELLTELELKAKKVKPKKIILPVMAKETYVFNGVINSNKEYYENLVLALNKMHCLEFDNWSRIGMALKNQSIEDKVDYYDIYYKFRLQKYSCALHKKKMVKIEKWWQSYNPKKGVNLLKIASIIKTLKKENPELYGKINDSYKKDFKHFYSPKITCGEIKKYNSETTKDFVMSKGQRGILVKAGTGLGKTSVLFKQYANHKNKKFLNYDKEYKRVLIITYRRTLCSKYYSELKDFQSYLEIQGPITDDKVIVQLDSLHRVDYESFDLVIVDEITGVLSHFESELMKHTNLNIENFANHLQNAKRIVMVDAFLTVKTFESLQEIIDMKQITYIENSYQLLKGWILNIVNNYDITEMIKSEESNVFISSMSKNILETISEYVDNIELYTSDSQNKITNVNKEWKNKSIGHTQTIEAGIDCTIKDQFNLYGFANNYTSSVLSFLQMIRRCRHPMRKEITINYDHKKNFEEHVYLDVPSIERLIEYNLASTELSPELLNLGSIIKNGKRVVKKDFRYKLYVYNQLEKNLNRTYFLDILVHLAKEQGMIINYGEDYDLIDKEVKKEVTEHSKEKKEAELQTLSSVERIIGLDTFENSKHKNDLSPKQKTQIKLKSMLLKYNYRDDKYLALNESKRRKLLKFIMKKDNYSKWKFASLIKNYDLDEVLKNARAKDAMKKDDPRFKSKYAKVFLANELVKTIGFDSVKDDEKIDVKVIKNKLDVNRKRVEEIYATLNKLNGTRHKLLSVQTINVVLSNIGLKLQRCCVKQKNKYKISDLVDWDNNIYPQLELKEIISEPLFIE